MRVLPCLLSGDPEEAMVSGDSPSTPFLRRGGLSFYNIFLNVQSSICSFKENDDSSIEYFFSVPDSIKN